MKLTPEVKLRPNKSQQGLEAAILDIKERETIENYDRV